MNDLQIWLLILSMGGVTYAIRLSMILLMGRVTLSPGLRRGLDFVPPAVFSAIILPEVVRPGGAFVSSVADPRLLAGLAAVIVAWRTRSILPTIAAGMAVLWGIGWLMA